MKEVIPEILNLTLLIISINYKACLKNIVF
jgi:hypothetical protein